MATAITTKYLGPTNSRGSRVAARSVSGRSRTVPWDHALNPDGNHDLVANLLAGEILHREFGRLVNILDYHVLRSDLPGGKGMRVHLYERKQV